MVRKSSQIGGRKKSKMTTEQELEQHVQDIIFKNYKISADTFVLLVYDTKCLLTRMLREVYSRVIEGFAHEEIDFYTIAEDVFISKLEGLPAHSLVILVESGSFRTTKHRLRRDLVGWGHDVIEHTRLDHNKDSEIGNYIGALRYDTPYYVTMCTKINGLLQQKAMIVLDSGNGLRLTVDSEYEKPILNTGNFSDVAVKSGGFPIGEIFTEAKDLAAMSGDVVVFGFPGMDHLTHFVEPFVVRIEKGKLVSHMGPAGFQEMISMIQQDEPGDVQIREIGFGLNRGLGFDKRITEPTGFERFAGMHFSLGLKHDMYRKKMSRKIFQKYHVDIFCLVSRVTIGDVVVFEKGEYVE